MIQQQARAPSDQGFRLGRLREPRNPRFAPLRGKASGVARTGGIQTPSWRSCRRSSRWRRSSMSARPAHSSRSFPRVPSGKNKRPSECVPHGCNKARRRERWRPGPSSRVLQQLLRRIYQRQRWQPSRSRHVRRTCGVGEANPATSFGWQHDQLRRRQSMSSCPAPHVRSEFCPLGHPCDRLGQHLATDNVLRNDSVKSVFEASLFGQSGQHVAKSTPTASWSGSLPGVWLLFPRCLRPALCEEAIAAQNSPVLRNNLRHAHAARLANHDARNRTCHGHLISIEARPRARIDG